MSHTRFFPVRGILFLILSGILPVALLAQAGRGPTIVRRDLHHDVSPPLIDMIRNAHPLCPCEAGSRAQTQHSSSAGLAAVGRRSGASVHHHRLLAPGRAEL